ncbi:hypothetical protein EDD27_2760 [Nonomuraea polychroma]|uniref:Integral membrane protein n=1 Tax=Nonomuraea polychroma TaxID=46176 RepID=A0A438M3H7_9ACTN|nr:DUF6328 family protein [Nonomuraea polychroma]RVX40355.1 hypothetical protein EDD27_2760 [Nonomuraea polychroma]
MKQESQQERADRNFVELLQGARVAVTGVQVLFAFLLTVPFSPGFAQLSLADRWLFYVALVSAAVASICYIAPTAQHRVLFRQGRKETLVRRSNLYGILGALALAVSMTTATMLVIDYLFGPTLAWGTAAVIAVLALWTWFGQPALNRSDDQDSSGGTAVPSPSSGGEAVSSSRDD